jgi:phosphatidylinositol glycan class V
VTPTTNQPQWCHQTFPFIYSFIQGKYWSVGFLKYWELPQIPNFAMAAPPLLLLLWSSITHLKITIPIVFSPSNRDSEDKRQKVQQRALGAFFNLSIIPHAIHSLVFSLLILFTSHVQIILRVASSMPFLYWSAARLLLEHPRLGKWWVGWSIIWGLVGIVNWGVFLPPA